MAKRELWGMWPDDDALIAEIALKKGWIDPAKLQRALEIQSDAAAIGLDERLFDILVSKGFISDRDAREFDDAVGLARLAHPGQAHAIEGYRILAKLGQVGMGVVFRAIQLSTARPVALKVLSPDLAKDASFAERFQREAGAVERVNHPNIVGGLDSGRSGGYSYYAMDFVEGETLRDALRAGPLPVGAALDLAAQMAAALGHLESLGLMHRDVRPGNIILRPDGAAMLCNLGLARLPGDPSVTDTGIPLGSPPYSSPELAAGASAVDIRSDIYSLGAALYHALTGQRPFEPEAGGGLPAARAWAPPIELRPELPKAASDLLCRMMAREPGDRFQRPGDLLPAVRAIQAEMAASRRAEGEPARVLPAIAPPERPASAPLPAIAPPGELTRQAELGGPLPTIAAPSQPPPLAPPQPRRRRGAQVAWTVAFTVLSGMLVVSTIWAVRSRLRRSAGGPTVARETPDGKAADAKGPPGKPLPSPQQPPDADAAPRLAEAALAFDTSHPKAHGEAMLQLRRAMLCAGDPPAATKLRLRLVAREQLLTEAARTAHNELRQQLEALCAEDRFGDALRACAAYPGELRYGVWAERAEAAFADVAASAEQRYLELATKGAAALRGQKFDAALGSYKRIAALGIPWMASAGAVLLATAVPYVEAERKRVDEAADRQAALDRRDALGKLSTHFARAQAEVKKRDYARALAICKAIPEALRQGECGEAVAYLEGRIAVVADLWQAIEKGPSPALGKPFKLYGKTGVIAGFTGKAGGRQLLLRVDTGSGERTLPQQIRRLPAPQLGQLAGWATERDPPAAAALKLGLLYLAEEEAGQARAKLQEAAKLGIDVARHLDELEAGVIVAGALSAHRQSQWDEARKLLDMAFGRFGATPPVIVDHAKLSQALEACAAKSGQPVSVESRPPGPLPMSLRRIVLLPETRLSPWLPADPLAAHFGKPLGRGGPVRLGLSAWRDYTLSLRWIPEQGGRFVLAARVSEPSPGQFAYYYLALDGGHLALGRRDAKGDEQLASTPCPGLLKRRRHRLTFSLVGSDLAVSADGGVRLEASDAALLHGHVALATSDSQLLIQEFSALLGSGPRGRGPLLRGR